MPVKSTKKKVLFYYLSAFSHTGGIEKFNRCFIKALEELSEEGMLEQYIVSVYDENIDERYGNKTNFNGFAKNRFRSLIHIARMAYKYDILILGHINVALAAILVKLIRPRVKLIMIGHGIEIWNKQYFFKKWCLRKVDKILSVSHYTRNQLVLRNNVSPEKIKLFHNTIDPFFNIPSQFQKSDYLKKKFGIDEKKIVILTLSRIVISEQYKGYDKVIKSLPKVLEEFPNTVYLLAGKFDNIEKQRIEDLVKLHHIEGKVLLAGFIPDDEVPELYKSADIFIMPSRKEGFGIVFLEAMVCGTLVIGGNQDGTVDALKNGSLGCLINPTKTSEISNAILSIIKEKHPEKPGELQKRVMAEYGFPVFKERLKEVLL